MALAIDASTPAVVTNTVSGTTTLTTGSFTPPSGSTLLILWSANSTGGTNPTAPSITDSLGTHLTYTLIDWQSRGSSPTVNGQAASWWASVSSSAAMTVTVTNNTGTANEHQAELQVIVLTGAAASPIGAHGASGSTSASSIAQSYTAQATGGWGFISVCDWDATGTPSAGTGCSLANTGDAGTVPTTQFSYAQVRRTTADDSNGSSNALNVTLAGTSTNLSWVYAEVLPAASGSFDAQVSITRQQSSVTRVGPIVATPTLGPPQVIQLPQIVVAPQARLPQPPAVIVSPPQIPTAAILSSPAAVVAQQFRPAVVAPIVVTPPPLPQPAALIVVAAQQFRPAQVAPVSVNPPFLAPAASAASILVAPQQFRPQSAPPVIATPTLLPSGQPEPSAPVWINPSQTQPFLAAVTSVTPPPLPQALAPIIVVAGRPQPVLSATITLTPSPLPQPAAPVVVVTSTWQPRQPQIVVSQPQAQLPVAPVLPPAPVLVVPTFARFRLAPVCVLTSAVTSLCTTPRPFTGTTGRPGSGLTARPDTGLTEDPC